MRRRSRCSIRGRPRSRRPTSIRSWPSVCAKNRHCRAGGLVRAVEEPAAVQYRPPVSSCAGGRSGAGPYRWWWHRLPISRLPLHAKPQVSATVQGPADPRQERPGAADDGSASAGRRIEPMIPPLPPAASGFCGQIISRERGQNAVSCCNGTAITPTVAKLTFPAESP